MISAMTRGSGPDPLSLAPTVPVLILIGLGLNAAPLELRDKAIHGVARLGPIIQAAVLSLGTFIVFALAQDATAPFIYFQF